MSGHDSGYGGVREKGFLSFLFCCKTSEWQPYGSLSNGAAAFFHSPSFERCKLNPVDAGGSTPMYTKSSFGQPSAGACSDSKRRRLKENETIEIFVG